MFHTRCHRVIEGLCDETEPEIRELSNGHVLRCHLSVEQLETPVTVSAVPTV